MKRVRIVAIAAVALGAAVTAGTKFQQSREQALAAAAPVPAAMASVPSSLTALAPGSRAADGAAIMTASVVPGVGPSAGPGADLPVLPGMPQDDLLRLAQLDPDAVPGEPLDPELQAELDSCAVWLVVTPAPGAMLETSVYAPCDAGATVNITHAGLTFDTRLADDGQLMLQVPAMSDEAELTLTFADGRSQTDSTPMPDLASVERVVLQWQAPASILLHAYEFGAMYGEPGHVHAGAPMEPGHPGQGFLTVLGDPTIEGAHLAQVYSYPRGESPRTGRVTLELEAPVTDATCGHPLNADAIELHGTVSAQVRQIRLDMPDCDGNGGYIVLPGVLPELQIALN